jgi:phage/conjugal plasmid C-4 type zinc finger TraR family protein
MDAADRAQAQAEWLEQFRAAHRRKHVMRVSDFCIDCHEAIEPARLKAEPTATRCVYCQTAEESLRRRYAP